MIKRIRDALLELEDIECIMWGAFITPYELDLTEKQFEMIKEKIGESTLAINNLLMELIDDNDNNSGRTDGGESKSWVLRNGHVERRLSLIQGGKQEPTGQA